SKTRAEQPDRARGGRGCREEHAVFLHSPGAQKQKSFGEFGWQNVAFARQRSRRSQSWSRQSIAARSTASVNRPEAAQSSRYPADPHARAAVHASSKAASMGRSSFASSTSN